MAKKNSFELSQDRKGMIWDLLLYVPTVTMLVIISLSLWYGGNQLFGYVILFASTFILLIGVNRILGTRLMILPGSPVSLDVSKREVRLKLRNGDTVNLVSNVRFFADFAGKSIGLSGVDTNGKRRQFVLHRGQFQDENEFSDVKSLLSVYR